MSLGLVVNSAGRLAKTIEGDEVVLKIGVFVRSSNYQDLGWKYLGSDSVYVSKEEINEAVKRLVDHLSYYVRGYHM